MHAHNNARRQSLVVSSDRSYEAPFARPQRPQRPPRTVNIHAHVIHVQGWPRKKRQVHSFEIPQCATEGLHMLQLRFGRHAVVFPATALQSTSGLHPKYPVGQLVDTLFQQQAAPVTPRGAQRHAIAIADIVQRGQVACTEMSSIESGSHFIVLVSYKPPTERVARRTTEMLRGSNKTHIPEQCREQLRPTSSAHLQRYLDRQKMSGMTDSTSPPERLSTMPQMRISHLQSYPVNEFEPLLIGRALQDKLVKDQFQQR